MEFINNNNSNRLMFKKTDFGVFISNKINKKTDFV